MKDAELKSKWLAALRSGEYAQTAGVLRKNRAYCCLGVLCDIASPGDWLEDEDGEGRHKLGSDNELGSGREFFGLSSDAEIALIKMNDEDKLSFSQIADYIEREL